MKNLFKLIIGPYLILWVAQIAASLYLMLCFDHVSRTNFILHYLLPAIFVLANYWLCNKLIGLFSDKREGFDRHYPGKHWQLAFFRYNWPLISIAVPYIFLALFCYSGLYWLVQEKYFMWPEIPGAAYFSARGQIVFILKFLARFSRIVPIFIFASVYNAKKKNLLAEKMIVWFLLFNCLIYSLADFTNFNKTNVLGITTSAASFFWYIFLKPRKPKTLYAKKNFSYYFFVVLVLCQFVNPYKLFSGFIFPYSIIIIIVLACYSLRAGWKAFFIGGLCGINVWSAVWWFLCLPDSIVCKCKNCGAKTISTENNCPNCKQILDYKVYSLTSRLKINIRPGAVIALTIFIFLFISVIYFKDRGFIIGKRVYDNKSYFSYFINVAAPYGFKNIVILKDNKVIGTNSAVNVVKNDKIQKPITYQQNGETLFSRGREQYSSNIIVRVAKHKWREKANSIFKNLEKTDYYIDKIQKPDMPDCDGELIELAYKLKDRLPRNLSLYNCFDFMFSNYWYSLEVNQRKARFNYYFKSLWFPKSYMGFIAKYSEPGWFKSDNQMPIVEQNFVPNFKMPQIYNENQIKKYLFSKGFLRFAILLSEYPSVCASPLIREICANFAVRPSGSTAAIIKFDIYRSEKIVLPYLRTKKLGFRNFELYLKILAMNPASFTQKDFEIIKNEVLKKKNFPLDLGYVAALDRPELWNLIKNPTKGKYYHQYYNSTKFFPREIKSTNAFEICCKLEKEPSPEYLKPFFVNVFSRTRNKKAVEKVRQEIQSPQTKKIVEESDAINRLEIMKTNL